MKTTDQSDPAMPPGASRWTDRAWLAVIAVAWGVVFWRLSAAWSAGWEYAHGWAVPGLCALIVWARAQNAPPPAGAVAGPRVAANGAVVIGVLGLAGMLPVLEANRLWPAAQWSAAALAALMTIGWLARVGGLAWVRHFAFPLFFVSTALAWPATVHAPLVDWLAGWNASVAAELASLAGHPAIARGNIVEVGSGWVGVDEACAGLRSLQAVWMLAWFLGEAARLSAARRGALVAGALGLAFAGNAVRTVFLTVQIAAGGVAAHSQWHDVAGDAAMVATFVGVAVLAWGLQRVRAGEDAREVDDTTPCPLPRIAARGLVWGTLVVLLAAEIGTRGWFAWRGRAAEGGQWQLTAEAGEWRRFETAKPVREILNFSSADALQWTSGDAARAGLVYVFRWENAGVLGASGRGHSPEICMPAIGARMMAKPAPEKISAAGRTLEFERFRFETAGRTQHVFVAVWDAFTQRVVHDEDWQLEWKSRLARVRDGRVRADRAQVMFVLETARGVDDAAAAEWLHEVAPRLLRAR